MSSALLSFLPTSAIQERVPERVMPKAVSSASVVTGRNKTRYTPISGQTYSSNGQTIITWRITDTQSFLDLATAYVHFRLSGLTGDSVPDDMVTSLFDRCRVSVNGVLVEDVTDVNVKAITDMYAGGSREWYDSVHGSYAGAWKWAQRSFGGDTTGDAMELRAVTYRDLNITGAPTLYGADATGVSFAVPLSLLTGVAKMSQYFPLRLMGNLEIVLFLAQGDTACWSPAGAGGTAFTLQDVTLECDALTLAPVVVSAYDKLASADSSEGGVVLPVDVTTTNRINYSGGTGSKTLQVSRGTTQLLGLTLVKRDSNDLSAKDKLSLSSFEPFGAVSYQTQIGAILFPSFKDDSFARMWCSTAKAYGKFANQISAGIISRDRYQSDAPVSTIAVGTGVPTLAPNTDHLQGQHVYALSYEQELYESVDLQGISTLASGSVIQVQVEDSPTANGCAGSPVANVFIRSRRYIQLANQSVQVIGN